MNKLSTERRAQVLGCLVEGMSLRATVRGTGVAKNSVIKLLADLGRAAHECQDGLSPEDASGQGRVGGSLTYNRVTTA